jgi:hypothetical protein
MTYASISRLRELTNFDRNIIDDREIIPFIPLADKLLNSVLSTRHHLEILSGTIDGTNKLFRTKHKPIADFNLGNVTILDACDVVANWTEGDDGDSPSLGGKLTYGAFSIRLGKSPTTSTDFSYSQTLGSTVDGTGKRLKIDLWIEDIFELRENMAVQIRIGNDSSNYHWVAFDRQNLQMGLNTIDISLSDMGSFGTPTDSTLDYLLILLATPTSADTVTLGNIRMDFWRLEDPTALDVSDVDVYFATLDTDNEIVYGSRQTLTSVLPREGRVTLSTAPTSTTASEGVFANYRSTIENIDRELAKDCATYILAHLSSFKIAGQSADYQKTEAIFLRRDIAGAPDEWLRLAITIANTILGSKKIGLRDVKVSNPLRG